MITYICGTDKTAYKAIPGGFWGELYTLLKDGDEILLGDSDFDHRVYGRCRIREYGNVSVMQSVETEHCYPAALIKNAFPSYVNMLKKCDRMIAVWDGMSEEVFINIILLLALNKKCRLYHLPSGKCIDVETIYDLKPYVKQSDRWSKEDAGEILRRCGFSEEMIANNTENTEYSEELIAEIICKAPVPLKEKYDMLMKIHIYGINYDLYIKTAELLATDVDFETFSQTVFDEISGFGLHIDECCIAIQAAQYDLEPFGMLDEAKAYCLFSEWYDTDVFTVKSVHEGVFDSVKSVMKYIKLKEQNGNGEGCNFEGWYRLEVWNVYDSARKNPRYDYYIFNGEICWFEKLCPVKEKNGYTYYSASHGNRAFLGGTLDLNMTTPFKAGDIVNIDCRPFGPPFHALITEAYSQHDCCMPQILFKMPDTDLWRLDSLKHKRFYKDAGNKCYAPVLSPLFRISPVKEDDLTKDDDLLIKFSKELDSDKDKARAFRKEWNKKGSFAKSEEEALSNLKNLSCKLDKCPHI